MRKKVLFYTDEKGGSPVWNFILGLSQDERNKCVEYIKHLKQMGESIRRPIGDYLGSKLYELRPKQTRIIYFFLLNENVVLVHAFRKKTNAIPFREIRLAINRMNNYIIRFDRGLIKIEEPEL